MATIIEKTEGKRGCGFRRKGLYMICDGSTSSACGKLPVELCVCPMCGEGIKHSKGFRWVNSDLFAANKCSYDLTGKCATCPLGKPHQQLGLMWVGKTFYATPSHFEREARTMGVSKRIGAVPRNFKVGETWILLAHIEAVKKFDENDEQYYVPGVFTAFKPSRIEYVIGGDETEEELDALEKRGFTLVKVIVSGAGDEEEDEDEDNYAEEDL